MTCFKVDDSFHSHAKALRAGNAALGLWVRCGSYCAHHLTDGFVHTEVVKAFGGTRLVQRLVDAKLFEPAPGGWLMHDYGDFNPSAARVRAEREAATRRQRNARLAAKSRGESQRGPPVTA